MKALSGYAEYFWCLAKRIKDIENRDWPLWRFFKPEELPVRVYLHASRTEDPECRDHIMPRLTPRQAAAFSRVKWANYRGAIIGEVTITGCVHWTDVGVPRRNSKWFVGSYGFLVEDGELYRKPIPYRGQFGFFEVKLSHAPKETATV